jgi:hypothetical protein
MEVFTLDSTESRIGVAAYVLGITYLGGSMLSLGASLIAPAAENHAIVRRLIALAALLVLIPLGFVEEIDSEIQALFVAVIAVPAIVIALTDSAPLVSTVCKPFVKRGPIGKAAGWLLYPCWPSGILFAILLGLVAIFTIFTRGVFPNTGRTWGDDEAIVILSLFGGLLFPSVWQVFLFRGEGQRVAHYLLLLAGSVVVMFVRLALADSMNSGVFLWFFAWNPLAFIPMLEESHISNDILLIAVIIVDLALLMLLTVKALLEIRKAAPVIQETEASLQPAE